MPRILKANINGTVEVAVSDTDYASVAKEKKLADDAQQSVNDANSSKASAASSAGTAASAATIADEAATAAEDFKVVTNSSKETASLASDAATVSVGAIRIIQFISGDIAVEALDRAIKAAYYGGLASRYAQEANEIVEKAGLGIRIKQIPGIPGAAGAAGVITLLINSNINVDNSQVTNISQSPEGDYDAVSAKFYWDLFNDNVEVIWP